MFSKIRVVLWIGIVVLFLPFFGVTDRVRTVLTIAIGLLLIYIAFALRHAYKKVLFTLRQEVQRPATDTTSING